MTDHLSPAQLVVTVKDVGGVDLGRVAVQLDGGSTEAHAIDVVDANGQPLTATNGDDTIESLVVAAHAARDAFLDARRTP